MNNTYDVNVIGADAGGCIAAALLADGGMRVLLLECDKIFTNIIRDHLRNHYPLQYCQIYGSGDNIGNPWVFVVLRCNPGVVKSFEEGDTSCAMGVGGGTKVYVMQVWGLFRQDFKIAITHVVSDRSSLANYPIDCDERAMITIVWNGSLALPQFAQ